MLLDTSAWIEFFIKSEKGTLVKSLLESEKCCTSIVTLAEISNWAMKEKLDGKELIKFVFNLTKTLELSSDISFLAGELNFQRKKIERNWGMLDSFILATAQVYDLKILTKDSHFKDLPNVELL